MAAGDNTLEALLMRRVVNVTAASAGGTEGATFNPERILEDYIQFNSIEENKGKKLDYIRKYDASVWEGYNIISPDRELEDFECKRLFLS